MTPVINPWIFYLMPICESISFTCSLSGILVTIAAIVVCVLGVLVAADPVGYEDSVPVVVKKLRKVLVPAAIILVLLGTFIPSESTITKMLIAENVTYERVESATNTVESVYNDIMELFEEDGNG